MDGDELPLLMAYRSSAHPRTSFSALAFAHRACTALRAISLRCSGVIFTIRAAALLLPPLRPNATHPA